VDVGLGPILDAFPNATFPLGAVHEFLSARPEGTAATTGFIAGLLSSLMEAGGISVWISAARTLFPPGLKNFGIPPDRFIFVDLKKEKDVEWAMEEALKCSALTAVVGEMKEISFTASRRLQLAVEQSQVTGFILRNNSRKPNTTACVSRWKITPLSTESSDDLPGIGFPQWKVELMRIRNGRTGIWTIQWREGRFVSIREDETVLAGSKTPWRDMAVKKPPTRGASVSGGQSLWRRPAAKSQPPQGATAAKTG
jgi:protein ImuA